MYFTPESRVSHTEHGVGTVIHATVVTVTTDGTGTIAYVVQFADGGVVTFSEAAALAELSKLRDNDTRCPFCDESLQGQEIPEESQHWYGATHFSRAISINDPNWGPVATQCPKCNAVWESATGKRIKRLSMFWLPYGELNPRSISEFGPVHLWNIRRFRRLRGAKHDAMDQALSAEIRLRWYAAPLILLWALPSRLLHDRKRRKDSKALAEALVAALGEEVS